MKLKKTKRPFGGKYVGAERPKIEIKLHPGQPWPRCDFKGCELDGRNHHACITCEKLGKEHKVHYCPLHRQETLGAVKRHALLKHPANLLRVVGAGLAGEDIT